ncbi:hypothetical protein PsorP6_009592 [Peronosclerospora sorghi]|uniref:Uncharacterized protein n=1 Tax=Peronosclerospora sorghi TaxID=230839 RepID=A0ACC0W036_9STRA|nr:hypothetical protein PsorP6_009592 [Peronosclerospora sorghi]
MDALYGGRDNVEPSATLDVGGLGGVKVVVRGDKEPKAVEIVGDEEEPKLCPTGSPLTPLRLKQQLVTVEDAVLFENAEKGSLPQTVYPDLMALVTQTGGNLSDDRDDSCKSPTPEPPAPSLEDAIAPTNPAKAKRKKTGDATPQDIKVRTGGKDKDPIELGRNFFQEG